MVVFKGALLAVLTLALLSSSVMGHRALNSEEQEKVNDSMSLEEEQRAAILAERKHFERQRMQLEEWQNEKDPKARVRLYMKRYAVELVVLAILSVCAVHFLLGRKMNKKLANKWLSQVEHTLHDSFSYVPEECTSGDGKNIVAFEDPTSSEFPINLAGRDSLKYASFNLVTKPRHDIAKSLFTSIPLVNRLFENSRDVLWVEIPIERKQTVHSEILFVQQKELKASLKAQPHLDILMHHVKPNTTSTQKDVIYKGLLCMAENQESIDALFADKEIC